MSTSTCAASSASHGLDSTLPGGYKNSSGERNMRLFDMDKLGIPQSQRTMFLAVNEKVRDYMYQEQYDPSHDYEHIQRVVTLAQKLYTEELNSNNPPSAQLDPTAMYLAAMMHDVGEPKYAEDGKTQKEVIVECMVACGASLDLAKKVATIAVNVSFTREFTATDRTVIHKIIEPHPELAFVQDGDRLDSLGTIGQARCFVYGGANPVTRQQTIHRAIQMHDKRFKHYMQMIKTTAGRAEAEKRWARMERFRLEWNEETDVGSVL